MIFDFLIASILGPYQGTLKSCKSSVKVRLLKSFRFSRYGVFFIFDFFFKKLRYKKLIELKFLNPTVGCYRGNFEGYKSSVQVWLLKSLWFSRYGFFMIFSVFFPKNLDIKKTNRTWFSIFSTPLYWGPIRVRSRAANLASKYDCSFLFGFRGMALFMIFYFFLKKIRYKKLIELKFLNPSVGCYRGNFEGYKSSVQVWLLKSLWFSRYGFFNDFFSFFKKLIYKKN